MPSGSFIAKSKPKIPKLHPGETEFFKVKAPCTDVYIDEGTWCQGGCVDLQNPVVKAMKMNTGSTCADKGYTVMKHKIQADVFVMEQSPLPVSAKAGFHIEDDVTPEECNMHYVVKQGICESFCVGTEGIQHLAHLADTHHHLTPGNCNDV